MNRQQLEGLLSVLNAGQVTAAIILVETALLKMDQKTSDRREYNREQKARRRRVVAGKPEPGPEPEKKPARAKKSNGVEPMGGWSSFLCEVLTYANSICGRNYVTKKIASQYRTLMVARAQESFRESKAEFPDETDLQHWQRVFNRMCLVWDEKLRQSTDRRPGGRADEMMWDRRYIRPETLYTGRFHSYVQEGVDRMKSGVIMLDDAPEYPVETNRRDGEYGQGELL